MHTDRSDSYLVVERMIPEGNVTALELSDLLVTLESQGLISASEHAALLELAADAKTEERPSQQAECLPADRTSLALGPGSRD